MGSPALFSGNFVKFLKNKLNLFDAAYILTGTQDPRATATDAPKGSIMLRQTASGNGQVFFKLDNGSSTNWKLFSADTTEANKILESLKNQLSDSAYNLLTTNIGGFDGSTKYSAFTGAAFDPSVDAVRFTADAQVATSVSLFDFDEFSPNGQDITDLSLSLYWNRSGAIPAGFTYEVSRDGGTNWFPVTMSRVGATNAFSGSVRFDTSATTESVDQTLQQETTNNSGHTLTGTTSGVAQKIVVPAGTMWVVKSATVTVTKTGTPVGLFTASIVRDNAGVPSIVGTDVLSVGTAFDPNTLTTGSNAIGLPDVTLSPGTYWLVFQADSTYMAASGANNINFNTDNIGGIGTARYVSSVWTSVGDSLISLVHTLLGRAIDLRVRVTSAGSPSYPCLLDGYGLFYGILSEGVQIAEGKKIQKFVFNSVTDNLSSFAITNFNPDPDLLVCWYVEGGQGFKVPAFYLNGMTAVFPANTFNNGGVSATITLIFEQNDGGTIDSSDFNTRLLAFNHLGSTDATDDRSTAGRGLFLRRLDGTLRELVINNDDEIEIWSV